MTPTIEMKSISPGLAKKWLDTLNTNNRKLRPRKVKQYAGMMTRGQWIGEGDTYKFDSNGILLDGQHRLAAIVEANYTVRNAVVMSNLPPESFQILDSGMLRSPGDALGHDVTNSSHKAAAIRLIYVAELEEDPRKSEALLLVTRTDIADFYHHNSETVDYAVQTGSRFYSAFSGGNRSAWAAFVWLAMRASPSHAEEFLEGVLTGANLSKNDARLALRNWLSNDRRMPSAGAHLGLLIKAWNNWMTGKTRMAMVFREDETFLKLATRKTITSGAES